MKNRRFNKFFILLLSALVLISACFASPATYVFADAEVQETEMVSGTENADDEIREETEIREDTDDETEDEISEPASEVGEDLNEEDNDSIQSEDADDPDQNNEQEITVSEGETEAEAVEASGSVSVEDIPEASETITAEEEPTEVHPVYGTATGNEGSANESGNVTWKEYEKDGIVTLLFSVSDAAADSEERAITAKFRNTEYASRVNRIVLEEGISGIGWMYLYDRGNYTPQYSQDYTVDPGRTDTFQSFQALTEVIPCSTLERIGWSAFKDCKNLSSFDFTVCRNLREVMNQAFYGCKSLNTIDLTYCRKLELLAWSCFNGAGKGSGACLTLPADSSAIVIGGHAFDGWKNIVTAKPDEIIEEPVIHEMTVIFTVEEAPAHAGSVRCTSLPEITGQSEFTGVVEGGTVIAPGVSSLYYQTIRGTSSDHFPYYTYEFRGWRLEDGSIAAAGQEIAPVDADGDGYAYIVSAWSYTWKLGSCSSGTPSVNYNIWTNVSSADDQIDQNVMLAEPVTNYTPKVAAAIMYALGEGGRHIYSDELCSPATGGTEADKYMMITYLGSTIVQADSQIRTLASEGFSASDPRNGNVTWKLSYFPEDEEVLASLAEMVRAGRTVLKDESGNVIPADELNTDNFVVRWCHVKYQSGNNDGWNINGKLTRKASYTAVTKTFSGDEEAIAAAIAQGFNITLTNTVNAEEVITLTMEDRCVEKISASSVSYGRTGSSTFGYVKHEGNTYTWIVICDGPKSFRVAEQNYNVTVDGLTYGISAQYNQTGTGSAWNEMRRQWTDETNVRTETHPTDSVDFDALETTNFYNEYIPMGKFYIEKYDDYNAALENVIFSVYEDGNLLKLYRSEGEGVSGQAGVLYENGGSSDSMQTDAYGRIILTLPVKSDETSVYTIVETIPAGYEGTGSTVSFNVSVTSEGVYSISDIQVPLHAGSVSELSNDGHVWGAKVINNRIQITDPAPTGTDLPVAPAAILVVTGAAVIGLIFIRKKEK